tara:strand:+ start:1249 stop:2118 length:870 start_codon:yes stop_codon:yes gene_type:complete
MRIVFEEKEQKWRELEDDEKVEGEMYIDGLLADRLDYIQRKLLKHNWDVVILVDGIEGSGKSTLAIQVAWFLSNAKLRMDHLILGLEDAPDKLEKAQHGDVFLMDEGSLSFSSRETMKREQVELVKIFNVIRQKNLALIVVAPSFFDLNKYIAVQRSRCLIHVYTEKDLTRGRYAFFTQKRKNILFTEGKKNYNTYAKPEANFYGRFTDSNPLGEPYIKAKELSLFEAFQSRKKKLPTKKDMLKELVIKFREKNPKETQKNIAKNFGIAEHTVGRWLKEAESTKKNDDK